MAKRFTKAQWAAINGKLEENPARFGVPEGGRERSLVFASFNIRKLGGLKNRETEIDFMARFCACCDLVAIQEIQDDLGGLRHLLERTEAHVAGQGEYALAVSDITGEVPGETGMAERLAFLYRHRRVRRLDMASDLTFDRTAVFKRFFDNEDDLLKARRDYERKLREFKTKTRKTKPTFQPPAFVTFVRTPYVAAFELPAADDMPSITFTAVNAHLVYGTMQEREQEFEALLNWLVNRLKDQGRLVAPNFILLGDLNLDFDKPRKDRARLELRLRDINTQVFGKPDIRRVYFPFLDKHPKRGKVLRTNARASQTYDQIAFFNGPREKRLPNDRWRESLDRNDPDGFDYGVFDFADLFAQALDCRSYHGFSNAKKKDFGKSFEHSVSDHLPIWVRIPRPGFASPPA